MRHYALDKRHAAIRRAPFKLRHAIDDSPASLWAEARRRRGRAHSRLRRAMPDSSKSPLVPSNTPMPTRCAAMMPRITHAGISCAVS